MSSSLMVEPLVFCSEGVGNPGTVYRRTINKYNKDYGVKVLSRFKEKFKDNLMNSEENCTVIVPRIKEKEKGNGTIKCDLEGFKEVIKKL
jgi:hypothetical protein